MPMNWNINHQITDIALHIYVDLADADPEQYPGRAINTNLWKNFTINRNFPSDLVVCSPANIIKCFQKDLFLEGLILTTNWGKMSGTVETIYQQDIETIREWLKKCKEDINLNNSIQNSWDWLTTELGWTNVMTSKLLHFLCRSLGYNNVPAPIDGSRIIGKFKPHLRNFLIENMDAFDLNLTIIKDLLSWDNNDYNSYLKYMGFILQWSDGATIEFESRLFNNLKGDLRPTLEIIDVA